MRKSNRLKIYRVKYQNKRRGKKFRIKRIKKITLLSYKTIDIAKWSKVDPISLSAPDNLSLVNYPDGLVNYLKKIRSTTIYGQPVLIDISQVKTLTYEIIPVLISFIKNKTYFYDGQIHGNGPLDAQLRKVFTESGFYNFVRSVNKFKSSKENLLHQESNLKVKPEIANRVTILVEDALNKSITEDEIEAIYNIFIELMSNTHHHADSSKYGHTKWWLFSHCDKDEINITFIDQGVGIFKSRIVKERIKLLGINFQSNIKLVDDLLDGKIQSRIDIDNEIRGKGLPQIVEYSKWDIFESFYIVTNDIWINLKNRDRKKLSNHFNGTLINFTIKNKLTD